MFELLSRVQDMQAELGLKATNVKLGKGDALFARGSAARPAGKKAGKY
jgi:hypothetical protein